jgi:lipopolysaccharide transport system permease protein
MTPARVPHLVIDPVAGLGRARLGDLWQYRELVYLLAWRDIKVRYKHTVLGIAWAVLQPVLTTAVFSIFFGALAKVPSDGLPYPLFAMAALVPWTFFANALTSATNSLVGSAALITKVYFPRLTVPIAAVLGAVIDLGFGLLVLLGLQCWFGVVPGVGIALLPVVLGVALISAFGGGLWFAALNVRYRDVRYVLPFVLQFWMFVTPVAYPASLVPSEWRIVYALNPMSGVVEGARAALLGGQPFPTGLLAVSFVVAIVVLAGGLLFFRHVERTVADVV